MHRLRVIVTPPRSGTAQSSLTPTAYLWSDELMSTLNSKDLMINQEDQKFLSLDPAPLPSDYSINTYYKRVSQILPSDREKLAVMMPVNDWMERVTVINHLTPHSWISIFTDH